jgi:hypothetical protein
MLLNVDRGAHTAQVAGAAGTTGIGLIELYDANPLDLSSRLTNISARAHVEGGSGVLIAGFVIRGGIPKTVLIRGVGPTLTQFGLEGVLADPKLALYSGSNILYENDDWNSGPNSSRIVSVSGTVGAFSLPDNSKDSVLLVELEPGDYTAQLSGANGSTGIALIEVYDVP